MAQDVKPFRTIEEQIAILQNRDRIIEDEKFVRKSVTNLNYYRLCAYTLTLRKDDHFYDNVHFFNMKLRAVSMYLLKSIEVSVRMYIGYYKEESFKEVDRFHKFESDYKSAIEENSDK